MAITIREVIQSVFYSDSPQEEVDGEYNVIKVLFVTNFVDIVARIKIISLV